MNILILCINRNYHYLTFFSRKSPLPSPQEGIKKAKIGVTIKKSPNSDRTFESRLLDQDSEPSPTLKKKPLDAM